MCIIRRKCILFPINKLANQLQKIEIMHLNGKYKILVLIISIKLVFKCSWCSFETDTDAKLMKHNMKEHAASADKFLS
jgi:hypothetical protein